VRSSCMWVSRDWVSLPRSALVALIALLKCALKRSSSSAFDTSLDTSGCAAGCLRCIHENTMTNDQLTDNNFYASLRANFVPEVLT
jgi:hypothetical protein